jgi:hypothetical protein
MEEIKKTRFVNSKSKDGSLSAHISNKTAERLTRYCKATNQNRIHFIENCINARLDVLERDLLITKTKEELIDLILSGNNTHL